MPRNCTKCSLSTQKAVTGQSEVPHNQVKLIVISSYPGNAEEAVNLSLAPESNRRGSNNQTPAGVFIRKCFKYSFDVDPLLPDKYKPFEKYTYWTNVIKCKTKGQTVKLEHIRTCKDSWLDKELLMFHPKTPILLAGSDPVKALLGEKETVFANRNRVLHYKQHPVIVCENPINIEKGMIRQLQLPYDQVYENVRALVKSQINQARKNKLLDAAIPTRAVPISFGMSNHFFRQDINNIKKQVIQFISDNNETV